MRPSTRFLLALAGVAALVVSIVAGPTPAGASSYDKPVAKFAIPDPGVMHDGSRWVVLSTGGWDGTGHIATAPAPRGPWKKSTHRLLTKRPAWASKGDHSVWAPSVISTAPGHYVVYYAAVVAGQKSARCIGSGHSKSPTGPFTPNKQAVACYKRSGAKAFDRIPSEGANFSLIDPTPALVGSQLVLTYKTQYRRPSDKLWHTTIRLVQLDPAHPGQTIGNPIHAGGASIKIADSVNKYIEENPVLVLHNSVYTLFTSFGWYGTCHYATRFRQNTSLWDNWLAAPPHALPMSKHHTCGSGNAQVIQDPSGPWHIFFNGHMKGPHTPFGMYVGKVTWSGGTPEVKNIG
jgi:hypothetical protein